MIEETCCHVANALGYPSLKDEQKTVLTNYILGNDVFAMLPTGFEKSLCYAFLPCVALVMSFPQPTQLISSEDAILY